MSAPADYVLLYDKPPGVTSNDVVASVRRTLPRKTKVGHAGTLDPFATGLLLVPAMGILVASQGTIVELPLSIQRSLSFLPGRWDPNALGDAQSGVLPGLR